MFDIGIAFLALIGVFYLLKYWVKSEWVKLEFRFLQFAFFLKVLAGVGLTFIYTYYYPERQYADTFRYFDDSYYLHQLLWEKPWNYFGILLGFDAEFRDTLPYVSEMNSWFPKLRTPLYNDNRTIIRINAILRWFSFGSYYFHLIFFVFMGFVGQLLLFKAFSKYFENFKMGLAIILFFIPSLLFWSSGILKEGPLLLAFGYLLFVLEKVTKVGWTKKHLITVLLLLLALFHLKFYVAMMLVPILTLWWALSKWHTVAKWKVIIANYSAYFIVAVLWHFIRWKWSMFTVLKWKKSDFQGLGKVMEAKSVISTPFPLEDNPISFLLHLPFGLFNALFRPFLWEAYSPLIFLSALENVVLLAFIGICWYFRTKQSWSKLAVCFLLYAITLLTIIGMVTPIMGSLVRYKIPALPFLLLPFLMNLDAKKLFQAYPFLTQKTWNIKP